MGKIFAAGSAGPPRPSCAKSEAGDAASNNATAEKCEKTRKRSICSSLRQTEKRRTPPEGGTQTLRALARRRYEKRKARAVRSATAVPGLPASGGESEGRALKQLREEKQ